MDSVVIGSKGQGHYLRRPSVILSFQGLHANGHTSPKFSHHHNEIVSFVDDYSKLVFVPTRKPAHQINDCNSVYNPFRYAFVVLSTSAIREYPSSDGKKFCQTPT